MTARPNGAPTAIGAFTTWASCGFGEELVKVCPPSCNCKSPGKSPHLTGEGWETRATTPADLAAWDRQPANAGLRTRTFPTIDVDADDPEVAAAVVALAVKHLGATATRRRENSPRCALLYRLDGAPFKKGAVKFTRAGQAGKVEILADGQQVVVAGLHHTGVNLEWTPEEPEARRLAPMSRDGRDRFLAALRDRLADLGCEVEDRKPAPAPAGPPVTRSDDAERARDALRAINPDLDHDRWIQIGMALHSAWPEAGLALWDSWSAGGSKYPGAPELARRWRSFEVGGGVGLGTLFHDAQAAGWRPPREHAGARAEEQAAAEEVADPLPEPLRAGRLLDSTFPPVEFAIDPYFPKGEVTELVGAHGIFKSTAALAACLCVATGRCWGPGVVRGPARAAFITMEDGERTIARRVRAWLDGVPAGREREEAEANVRANFTYLAREHARGLALTTTDRTSTMARTQVVEHLSAVLAGAALVVLETASRLHDGPEMNEALAVFASAVERIAVSTSAAVCVVRHVPKQTARDGTTDSYSGRGGGSFSDAARSVLAMARKVEGDDPDPLAPVRLVHAKATHTAPGQTIVWRPVVSEWGVYLYALSGKETARAEAGKLLDHLRGLGAEGVTGSELHKRPPAGLSRSAAKAALDALLEAGQVVEEQTPRGRSKQAVTIYRLPSEAL